MQIVVHYERLFGFYLKKGEMKISLCIYFRFQKFLRFLSGENNLKMCLRIDTCLIAIDLKKETE